MERHHLALVGPPSMVVLWLEGYQNEQRKLKGQLCKRFMCKELQKKKRCLSKSTIKREVEWIYANFRIFFRCIKGRLRSDPSHLCKYLTFSQTLMHIRACGHRTFCVFCVCLSRKGKIACQYCASSDWSSPQSVSHSFQKSILKDLEPQSFFLNGFYLSSSCMGLLWHNIKNQQLLSFFARHSGK